MSTEEILARETDLYNVLQYCSEVQMEGKIQVFKVGERITINQERGALLTQYAYSRQEILKNEIRVYKVPAHIEAKIRITLEKINHGNIKH